MRIYKLLFALVLAAIMLVVIKALFIAEKTTHPEELKAALTEVARASVKAEYDLLVTGVAPSYGLVAQHRGETRTYLTNEQRLATALRVRSSALSYGRHYSHIEVKINPQEIEAYPDKLILRATEETTEHFVFDKPSPDLPNTTSGITRHNFIFSVGDLSGDEIDNPYRARFGELEYILVEDITEPQMLNASDGSISSNDQQIAMPADSSGRSEKNDTQIDAKANKRLRTKKP